MENNWQKISIFTKIWTRLQAIFVRHPVKAEHGLFKNRKIILSEKYAVPGYEVQVLNKVRWNWMNCLDATFLKNSCE